MTYINIMSSIDDMINNTSISYSEISEMPFYDVDILRKIRIKRLEEQKEQNEEQESRAKYSLPPVPTPTIPKISVPKML